MGTPYVYIDDLKVEGRLRPADPDAVARLAESISAHGLRTPITVRKTRLPPNDEFPLGGDSIVLVAGLHRLEAARKLGWDTIDCVWFEGTEREAEMWQIAENLHRVDLTKAQRDAWIRRYAELLGINIGTDCPDIPKAVGKPEGIASKIATEVGLSSKTIRRALAAPKPAPATPPAPAADQAKSERARAELYIAERLSEFPRDDHKAIAEALRLFTPAVARQFTEISQSIFGNETQS